MKEKEFKDRHEPYFLSMLELLYDPEPSEDGSNSFRLNG